MESGWACFDPESFLWKPIFSSLWSYSLVWVEVEASGLTKLPRALQSLWFIYCANSKCSDPTTVQLITISMKSLSKNYQNQFPSSKSSLGGIITSNFCWTIWNENVHSKLFLKGTLNLEDKNCWKALTYRNIFLNNFIVVSWIWESSVSYNSTSLRPNVLIPNRLLKEWSHWV